MSLPKSVNADTQQSIISNSYDCTGSDYFYCGMSFDILNYSYLATSIDFSGYIDGNVGQKLAPFSPNQTVYGSVCLMDETNLPSSQCLAFSCDEGNNQQCLAPQDTLPHYPLNLYAQRDIVMNSSSPQGSWYIATRQASGVNGFIRLVYSAVLTFPDVSPPPPPPNQTPQPPGDFTLTGTTPCSDDGTYTNVTLNWTLPDNIDTSNGVDHYDISSGYGIPNSTGLTTNSFNYRERRGVSLWYKVTAFNAQGSKDSNTITSDACPVASVSISANPSTVSSGSASTISWSSDNAQICTASGSWSGSKALSGTYNTGAISSPQTYTITCSDADGGYPDTQSATVSISGTQVNGACGTANKTYSSGASSYGSDTFCSAGTASPSSPAFPASGFSTNWSCTGSGGGSTAQCAATHSAGATNNLTVSLTPSIGGTVTSFPAGINCGSTCSSSFNNGTVVTLTPTPVSSYWQFAGWSGDCSGTGTCILTLSAPKSVSASFTHRNFNYIEF